MILVTSLIDLHTLIKKKKKKTKKKRKRKTKNSEQINVHNLQDFFHNFFWLFYQLYWSH